MRLAIVSAWGVCAVTVAAVGVVVQRVHAEYQPPEDPAPQVYRGTVLPRVEPRFALERCKLAVEQAVEPKDWVVAQDRCGEVSPEKHPPQRESILLELKQRADRQHDCAVTLARAKKLLTRNRDEETVAALSGFGLDCHGAQAARELLAQAVQKAEARATADCQSATADGVEPATVTACLNAAHFICWREPKPEGKKLRVKGRATDPAWRPGNATYFAVLKSLASVNHGKTDFECPAQPALLLEPDVATPVRGPLAEQRLNPRLSLALDRYLHGDCDEARELLSRLATEPGIEPALASHARELVAALGQVRASYRLGLEQAVMGQEHAAREAFKIALGQDAQLVLSPAQLALPRPEQGAALVPVRSALRRSIDDTALWAQLGGDDHDEPCSEFAAALELDPSDDVAAEQLQKRCGRNTDRPRE